MRQARLSHRSNEQDEATAPAAPVNRGATPFDDVMALQGSIGNAAVGHLLAARERASGEAATPVDALTQGLIADQAGGGEAMSAPLQAEMQGIAGGPVGGVRIHQGPQSDALTRRLGATGVTQGRDVFLRSDRDPASVEGRATLAHELTHVAQGSVGPGAVMREPDTEAAEPMDTGTQTHFPAIVAKITLAGGGTVDGGSQVPGHKGEVEFESLSLGSPGNNRGNSVERDTGTATFRDVSTTRLTDQVSSVLMKAMVDGDRIVSARFQFVKQVEKGIVEEGFSIEFTNGLITSFQVGGGGGNAPGESVTFSFEIPAK